MKKEVLWGTDEEINNYMFDLFEHLILEVFSDQNEYNLDIEKYLYDYIPYAKNSTYWEVIVKGIYPAMFYGVSEDKILCDLFPAREEAIRLIYNRCSASFKDYFFSFIEDKKSFRGIDKIFKTSFIDEKFVPLIRDNPPNSTSLGLRIQQLILEDLSHTASLIVGETINNIEYKKALIHASSEYILALEEIHETFIQKKEMELINFRSISFFPVTMFFLVTTDKSVLLYQNNVTRSFFWFFKIQCFIINI